MQQSNTFGGGMQQSNNTFGSGLGVQQSSTFGGGQQSTTFGGQSNSFNRGGLGIQRNRPPRTPARTQNIPLGSAGSLDLRRDLIPGKLVHVRRGARADDVFRWVYRAGGLALRRRRRSDDVRGRSARGDAFALRRRLAGWSDDVRRGVAGDDVRRGRGVAVRGASPAAASPFGGAQTAAAPGTGAPPYTATPDTTVDNSKHRQVLLPITAMPPYAGKSFEELRVEDYQQGNKGRGGAAPATPAAGGGVALRREPGGGPVAVRRGTGRVAVWTARGPGGRTESVWRESRGGDE